MNAGTRARLRVVSDVLVAVAAVLTVMASRWPWFHATLTPQEFLTVGTPILESRVLRRPGRASVKVLGKPRFTTSSLAVKWIAVASRAGWSRSQESEIQHADNHE
jgi:hypothetical protein